MRHFKKDHLRIEKNGISPIIHTSTDLHLHAYTCYICTLISLRLCYNQMLQHTEKDKVYYFSKKWTIKTQKQEWEDAKCCM